MHIVTRLGDVKLETSNGTLDIHLALVVSRPTGRGRTRSCGNRHSQVAGHDELR
jgi:hypothetical protein